MFRTIKVKLAGDIEPLVHTATMYTQACQLALDYGFKNKTHNKNAINAGTYSQIRKQTPQLPSGLVQCARDQAAEMLKRERFRRLSTKKRRKLKKLSGAERRFTLDVNHVIAKKLTQKPYDVFAVEALRIGRRKIHGRRFNRMLGGWSYGQLLTLLAYKAESVGKIVVQVNPRHTSQRCSKCGYADKGNRKSLAFKCGQCGFELNADLNAARNIGELGKSELVRLSVNQPIVAHTAAASPHLSRVGS